MEHRLHCRPLSSRALGAKKQAVCFSGAKSMPREPCSRHLATGMITCYSRVCEDDGQVLHSA